MGKSSVRLRSFPGSGHRLGTQTTQKRDETSVSRVCRGVLAWTRSLWRHLFQSLWVWRAVEMVLVVVAVGSFVYGYHLHTMAHESVLLAGPCIEINGERIRLHCVGQGKPTILLQGGVGTGVWFWENAVACLGGKTRVCVLDSPGIGPSGPATETRGSVQVHRWREALAQFNIRGPFVFVGHGNGAVLAIAFRTAFPEEVAGIVLVEPHLGGLLHGDIEAYRGYPGCFDVVLGRVLSWAASSGILRVLAWLGMDPTHGLLARCPLAHQRMLNARAMRSDFHVSLQQEQARLADTAVWVASRSADLAKLPAATEELPVVVLGDHPLDLDEVSKTLGRVVASQVDLHHVDIPIQAPDIICQAVMSLVKELEDVGMVSDYEPTPEEAARERADALRRTRNADAAIAW